MAGSMRVCGDRWTLDGGWYASSPMSIDRVFVIGAGLMGHGIAQVSAAAGKRVTLSDRTAELAEKGKARVAGNLARQVEKGKVEQPTADEILGRIATAEGTDAAAGHDIVIEAVFEDESVKRETWEALTRSADPGAIFASNTSSISITSLATATDRAPKFIGLHFFSPVPVMGLIEIIRGLETDDATHDAARGFAQDLGKTVIESRDYPGFLVNRMLGPFINEAVFALMESTGTAEDIDTGAKLGLNHPMGPLELSDFIGNDVMLNVMDVLHRGFGDPKFRAAPLLRQMVAAGHLGRKTGRGFYQYDERGTKIG
jgi:3-hydroxybutyryl-CoA dehydrogenase